MQKDEKEQDQKAMRKDEKLSDQLRKKNPWNEGGYMTRPGPQGKTETR